MAKSPACVEMVEENINDCPPLRLPCDCEQVWRPALCSRGTAGQRAGRLPKELPCSVPKCAGQTQFIYLGFGFSPTLTERSLSLQHLQQAPQLTTENSVAGEFLKASSPLLALGRGCGLILLSPPSLSKTGCGVGVCSGWKGQHVAVAED